MPGKISTHVLDTNSGRPAAGMLVQCHRLLEDGSRMLIKEGETNADGRLDAPLVQGDDLLPGIYELTFHVGAYFQGNAVEAHKPDFLDQVPVRFTVTDGTQSYHVPLLVTPWSYTTYRGS
ncbi:MAG TPA: hydroxyisourate hydrolase [Verrucomicrobium sp.]|nr:hydroxyisourate hydrolase [Verrucomicrobium sp.]